MECSYKEDCSLLKLVGCKQDAIDCPIQYECVRYISLEKYVEKLLRDIQKLGSNSLVALSRKDEVIEEKNREIEKLKMILSLYEDLKE